MDQHIQLENELIDIPNPSVVPNQSLLLKLTWVILKLLKRLIVLLPNFIYSLLSTRVSITVRFSTVLLSLSVISILLFLIIRYKILTKYSQIKDNHRQLPNDIHDSIQTKIQPLKKKPTGSYFDEFLTGIKIFGNLETNVLNDLTRSMKTQKLYKDEILYMDQKLGFSIVVDGNVQIFTKILNSKNSDDLARNYEQNTEVLKFNGQIYQLLNEVKTGNPLSSLINILELVIEEQENNSKPIILQKSANGDYEPSNDELNEDNLDYLENPKIIAKATSNCTIAIIPSEAFRILKRKHPRASSHIVQMILTRLYRVTFQTANNYLGLTRDIFETEINLNRKIYHEVNDSSNNSTEFDLSNGVIKEDDEAMIDQLDLNSSDDLRTLQNSHNNLNELYEFKFNSNNKNGSSHLDNINASKRLQKKLHASNTADILLSPYNIPKDDIRGNGLKTKIINKLFTFLGIDQDSLNSPTGSTFNRSSNTRNNSFSSSSSTANSFDYESSNSSSNYQPKFDFINEIEILKFEENTTIIEQNSRDNGLYYIIDGEVEVSFTDSEGKDQSLYTIKKGGVAGYIGSLVGFKSFVTIRSSNSKAVKVGYLSKKKLEKLCESYFMIYLNIAKTLIKSLSERILLLDSALEWIQLDAGQVLFDQDTDANGIYIILNGRLRSIHEDSKTKEIKILGEFGQGESFGEVEVLTADKRSSSFVAIRDSETARIPRSLFELLALDNPSIMIKISRMVAKKIKLEQFNLSTSSVNFSQIPTIKSKNNSNKNFRTIAIIPTTYGLPVNEFSTKLVDAFINVNRSVVELDQASILKFLGKHAFDRLSRLRQSGIFTDLEGKYQIVVYIADTTINSSWTNTCIQQADCVLLLADSLADPNYIGEFEKLLISSKTTPRVELCLLHPEKFVEPGLTTAWLKNRYWVHSHHHIQFKLNMTPTRPTPTAIPNLSSSLISLRSAEYNNLNTIAQNLKNKVSNFKEKYVNLHGRNNRGQNNDNNSEMLPHKNDFLRLARLLSGQAVGIILGGGGARGFSHLGVIKALEENGIPVDIIGGTSIGSFVGGLYARDYDLVPLYGRVKKFAGRVSSIWRTILDLTIPTTSYTTGHEFNRGIWKVFGDNRIEDFWIQFYCNSTNITNSCMEIHSEGIAWRFIRASMSLAGLLPPITDNGCMLLDGGYIDNLPVDEMKSRGANVIFAVDVGSVDERTPMNYGDSLSGAWILFNSWNPFSKYPNIPTMSEIQMRLCYVASVNALERAKQTPGLIYLRPPVDNYATLDFGKFEEIYNVGSVYGNVVLRDLIEHDELPEIAGSRYASNIMVNDRRIQRRNSI